ncbi:MAG: c-type cytochrome [Saprospiraceae bacterium]|nr:c-type cytochrome [Saprospiraceae bacterium]
MNKLLISILVYCVVLFSAVSLSAQEPQESMSTTGSVLNLAYDNIILLLAVLVLIGVILAGLNLVWALIEIQRMKLLDQYGPEVLEKANLSATGTLWDKISQKSWNIIPLEREKEIEMDHDYDGIRELDNLLPPWWVWLFYITIFWGIGYLIYYHFTDLGVDQETEYIVSIEKAEEQKLKFLAGQANLVDENSVVYLNDPASLEEGKSIYVANCKVCHGEYGEGTVGPNFTDKYWIHGGSIQNIFSTIKYGVPEKGMISWKAQLRPLAMQQVASYIMSLGGTNPPNPKAQEGILYEPEKEAPANIDSIPDNTDPSQKG